MPLADTYGGGSGRVEVFGENGGQIGDKKRRENGVMTQREMRREP